MSASPLALLSGIGLGILLLLAAWGSCREGETLACRRFLIFGLTMGVWTAGAVALPSPWGIVLGWGLVFSAALVPLLLLPMGGADLPVLGPPAPGVDERDILFSRAALVPGSKRFQDYYRSRPHFRAKDDLFRLEPGLLGVGSSQYHRPGFAAADAAFWTIERLRPLAEGDGESGGGAGLEGPLEPFALTEGSGSASTGAHAQPTDDPQTLTRFLKGWLLKLGAHSVGVTELRDYHVYSHVGRGPNYGESVMLDHRYALALTVEMDREMVDPAPRSPTIMESARQYLSSGVMAIQLADLIRRLGYPARAHVDGNYRVICPLVARDAGLGELGRMGLLMTPRLGPRVRIAVVTTDLPLIPDAPFRDGATLDFCIRCRKCADCCPSRALPFGDPEEDERGVLRWKIDAEACFTLWTRLGTDCARCMAVCPYSHPDNLLHNAIRWGIRRNSLFRKGAVVMDDLVYGRHPAPNPLPGWMGGFEVPRASSRSPIGDEL